MAAGEARAAAPPDDPPTAADLARLLVAARVPSGRLHVEYRHPEGTGPVRFVVCSGVDDLVTVRVDRFRTDRAARALAELVAALLRRAPARSSGARRRRAATAEARDTEYIRAEDAAAEAE